MQNNIKINIAIPNLKKIAYICITPQQLNPYGMLQIGGNMHVT